MGEHATGYALDIFFNNNKLISLAHYVTDGDFVYIYSAIFKYQTDLFYCAQDIGAVVCPFIYHYATHTGDGFPTVRHLGIIVRTDRTCVSGSGGNYPDPACLDARVKYRNCSVMLDCDV